VTYEETSAALTAVVRARHLSLSGGRIHRLYCHRQVPGGKVPTVLLTADCGEVLNLADVKPHNIGPTCRRCQRRAVIR
jgi:hypothetical protein